MVETVRLPSREYTVVNACWINPDFRSTTHPPFLGLGLGLTQTLGSGGRVVYQKPGLILHVSYTILCQIMI